MMTQLDVMRARRDAERLRQQWYAKWLKSYQGKLAQPAVQQPQPPAAAQPVAQGY